MNFSSIFSNATRLALVTKAYKQKTEMQLSTIQALINKKEVSKGLSPIIKFHVVLIKKIWLFDLSSSAVKINIFEAEFITLRRVMTRFFGPIQQPLIMTKSLLTSP
jgi:hypothetical protein